MLLTPPDAMNVDVEDSRPVFPWSILGQGEAATDACIVDRNIDATEMRDRISNRF
jgi:hypothetical protein